MMAVGKTERNCNSHMDIIVRWINLTFVMIVLMVKCFQFTFIVCDLQIQYFYMEIQLGCGNAILVVVMGMKLEGIIKWLLHFNLNLLYVWKIKEGRKMRICELFIWPNDHRYNLIHSCLHLL